MRFLSFLMLLGLFWSCSSDSSSNASHSEVDQWNSYELSKGVTAAFPQQPIRKVTDYNTVKVNENRVELKDSASTVYSVNLITNSKLKSTEDWKKYLEEEVLAFKAQERKKIKWKNYPATYSKVRQGNLFGVVINLVVENQFVLNIAMRRLGAYPEQELFDAFCAKVEVK